MFHKFNQDIQFQIKHHVFNKESLSLSVLNFNTSKIMYNMKMQVFIQIFQIYFTKLTDLVQFLVKKNALVKTVELDTTVQNYISKELYIQLSMESGQQTTTAAKTALSKQATTLSEKSTAATSFVSYQPPQPASLKVNPSTSIVVNLRGKNEKCRYDIFRKVTTEVFKWDCILQPDYVIPPQPVYPGSKLYSEPVSEEQQQVQQQKTMQQQAVLQDAVWDINWFDHGGLTPEWLSMLLPWQRVNHFLGMYNISRKNTLGIHLKRFQKEFPKKGDYDFFPQTWLYPTDFFDINEYYQNKLKKAPPITTGEPVVLFICKPEASSQGRGILIFKRIDEMRMALNSQLQAQQKQYQEYIQLQQQYDTAQYYSYTVSNASQNMINTIVPQNQQQSYRGTYFQQPQQSLGTYSTNETNNIREPPQAVEKNNTYVVQKYLKNPAQQSGMNTDFYRNISLLVLPQAELFRVDDPYV